MQMKKEDMKDWLIDWLMDSRKKEIKTEWENEV
jgi:hypothetical protein